MAEKKREMEMIRRIGSTVYKVRVRFSEDGRETMEDKILRMIRSEGMAKSETCGHTSASGSMTRDFDFSPRQGREPKNMKNYITNPEICDTIQVPQMSPLPERSA